MNNRIYTVTVDNYEWETSFTKVFSDLSNAIKFANMYGTFKDDYIWREFDKGEMFDENNWRKNKHITVNYIGDDKCKGKRWIIIDVHEMDNFNGLRNG